MSHKDERKKGGNNNFESIFIDIYFKINIDEDKEY
jgi:hypothetical protein